MPKGSKTEFDPIRDLPLPDPNTPTYSDGLCTKAPENWPIFVQPVAFLCRLFWFIPKDYPSWVQE
jgi:hypothetical protein